LRRPRDDVRWYYFSSGTTATAKGAKHSDASAMASSNAQIAYIGLRENDLFPIPFPITHIGGIMILTAYLRTGARLLLVETFDPVNSPVVMAEHGATVLGSATPFFHAYLAAQRRHGDAPLFPELRQLQAGGAPITPELNAECIRVFGTPIYNQWGLTEFPAATSLGEGDPPEKFNGTVGRMAPGAEVKVIGFDGEPVPDGGEGELWVRGPHRLLGYVDAALDADAFDTDGYFRTGDLGTLDGDGFLRITGRLKDIIIRNAENLSAQEIEDVLNEHPAVADVAVIGVPDPVSGERACAIVVLAPGYETLTIPELAEHCQAKGLAKQKIPEQLELVSELPRNPMGKVLKHVLRSQIVPRP
jgi:acyl-CoA synthetase (AMP-forming)/AMP-acid ligase II